MSIRLICLVCIAVVACNGQAATLASLTTYTDSLCTQNARSVVPSAGLCYNTTRGDFIVTSAASDASRVWFSAKYFSDSKCTVATLATAVFANNCVMEADGTYSVKRISAATWTLTEFASCVVSNCGNCSTKRVVPAGACVPAGSNSWMQLQPLGLGTGAFAIQRFQSTDGSCENPILPADNHAPDSTCYGQLGVQLSSL